MVRLEIIEAVWETNIAHEEDDIIENLKFEILPDSTNESCKNKCKVVWEYIEHAQYGVPVLFFPSSDRAVQTV